jgi:hypothetical protein
MQDWLDQHFLLVLPFVFAALWTMVFYVIAFAGGWRLLARRFRFQGTFQGAAWHMQSASMRLRAGYNRCLTVGSDNSGLFVRPLILFRLWHPSLFVPWTEITYQPKRQFFFDVVEFRLGREERVPFTVRKRLADKIQAAAGKAWSVLPIS